MGLCVSGASVWIQGNDDVSNKINPGALRVPLRNPVIDGRGFDDESKRQPSIEGFSAPSDREREREGVRSNISKTSSSIYSSEHGLSGRSTSKSQSTSFSSTLTDSFDPDNLLSFDGLNKRVTNRNHIGLEILKAKIHHGADPKSLSTHGGRTCLMFSVIANDFSFTKMLVELGVDVNYRTRLGETALGLATELQREEITKYLRTKGATKRSISA